MAKSLCATLLLISFTTSCGPAQSGQKRFDNYYDARDVFWSELYKDGGETLYCGVRFGSKKNKSINIEHVTPMAWAMNEVGCDDRNECRKISKRFNQMEADLHNLYPALEKINKERGSHSFGMVKGEAREFGKCDFEINYQKRLVEPRDASRGEIARAMFYMNETYGLKIFKRLGITLKKWHRSDPPNDFERSRNDMIEKLQGTRNRFIDDSNAAKDLWF
ncbi:MAG: endonuclease [Gammaproteobacteria bacterium]|nr:endonuclease [Gammaproteobacteria bacterium]